MSYRRTTFALTPRCGKVCSLCREACDRPRGHYRDCMCAEHKYRKVGEPVILPPTEQWRKT